MVRSIVASAKNWNLTSGKLRFLTGSIKLTRNTYTCSPYSKKKDFYSLITKTLLKNAIQFEHKTINKNNFEVMFHARKFLLFYSNKTWVKKRQWYFWCSNASERWCRNLGTSGIFKLSLLSKKHSSNNISLYCDDRLSVFRNISGQQAEKHEKIIQKIFKHKSLQIIIKYYLQKM